LERNNAAAIRDSLQLPLRGIGRKDGEEPANHLFWLVIMTSEQR